VSWRRGASRPGHPILDPSKEKSVLRRTLFQLSGAVMLAVLLPPMMAVSAERFDVLIRNGRVLDGTASPWRRADVGIVGDRIVRVGPIAADAVAELSIDAADRYVTPGFIDPHSHATAGLETADRADAESLLRQGITTVFINPDGGGPADLSGQLAAIEGHGPGVNVVPMIGHNGVRRAVLGLENRAPTEAELAQMQALVRDAMAEHAFGLSSGPFYIPGKYSDTDEIVAVAGVAAEFPGAFHISHVRDESNYDVGVSEAVKELIEVSRRTGIVGVVTHFKMLGPFVWGQSEPLVEIIDAARAEGLSIWADQYPYGASSTGLQAALVPGWAQEGGAEAVAQRLREPETLDVMRPQMVENLARRAGPGAMLIARHAADESLVGRYLDEIARERGQDPLDTAIDLLVDGGAGIVSFNMNEEDVERIMRQPWTMTSSDGGIPEFGVGNPHPRSYGAYPRKIRRYVLERGVITLEHMVHASSGLTASVLGPPDRGFLRPGAHADVLVFDPARVRDTATFADPHAYAEGMDVVLVNGRPAILDGELLAERHGRILRPRRGP
jgi:N-acyl-D-amino-acid deacylase